MRHFKKSIASIIAVIVALIVSTHTFASEFTSVAKKDLFASGTEEYICLEEGSFHNEYFLDSDGNRNLKVTNLETEEIKLFVYYANTGEIYMNNTLAAIVSNGTQAARSEHNGTRYWLCVQSRDTYINWLNIASTGYDLACIMSETAGYLGVSAIIACITLGTLSAIVSTFSNGRLIAKLYEETTVYNMFKVIWSFTPTGGSKYGDYESPWGY